jgi:hypothetical protein
MRVYRRGVLIDQWKDHNLIVDGARALVANLIAGSGNGVYINRIVFGTNGNIPVPHDTAITAPFVKTFDLVSFPGANLVMFKWSLAATEANGKEIREFGLLCEQHLVCPKNPREAPQQRF